MKYPNPLLLFIILFLFLAGAIQEAHGQCAGAAGPARADSCVVFPGGAVTMAAIDTGIWTAQGGNPGTAVITNPSNRATTITTFNAAGTYHFIWTDTSGCADTVAIVVTGKPNAGPDQTLSCVVFPGGSATMAAAGAGTWTEQAGNPGSDVITTPTGPTTTITTFSGAGTYYFIWTNASGCTDTAAVVVSGLANAGPPQADSCAAIPGGSVTMAATGTGTWTAVQTGNPGTAVITTPTTPTTTITTFSAAGTYHFIWTTGSCADTVAVTIGAKPNAGPDQTFLCSTDTLVSVTMAATGTGTWTAPPINPGTVTITAPTSPTTTITGFTGSGTYSFIWTGANGCTDTTHVNISGQCHCYNSNFSEGDFTGWTGTWGNTYQQNGCSYSYPFQYPVFNQGPRNFPDNSGNTQYSQIITDSTVGFDPYLASIGTNILAWYNGPNHSGYSARIGNTWPRNGSGDPDAESITYTFNVTAANAGFTYYYFPILNDGGHAPADQPYFKIRMVANSTDTIQCAAFDVDASNAVSVGGFSSTSDNGGFFGGGGLGAGPIYYKQWTPVFVPLTNYIGQTVKATFITRSCDPNGCAGVHFAIAYIYAQCGPITLTIAPHDTCTQNGFTITAPAGLASYAWSGPGISGATTDSIHAYQTGRYTVTMTTFGINPCTFTLDTTITISPIRAFRANFSYDSTCLGNTTYFHDSSAPAAQIVSWAWDFNNNGTTNSTLQNPSYTFPSAGTYQVKLTVSSTAGCTFDTIIPVVIGSPPTSPFTATGPVCIGQTSTIQYTGNGLPSDNFTWNFNGGTVMSGSGEGPYQVQWSTPGTKTISLTVGAGTCLSAPTNVQVIVTPSPTVTLPNYSICIGSSALLTPTVTPAGGTYAWSAGPTTPTITVAPIVTTHYTVTYTSGTCSTSVTDTVTVIIPNAGPDQNAGCAPLPGGTATMAATSTGTWNPLPGNPGTATITTPTSPTTTITHFTAPGTYSFTWGNGTCVDTAMVSVLAKPNAGPDQTVSCIILPGGTATMAASDTGIWTAQPGNPGTATITAPASAGTTITGFPAGGTYYYIWTDTNTCPDTTAILVTVKPNAGPDQTVICAVLPGGSATMAATGLGTWRPQTGNPGTATITIPASATTTITTYTAPGVYSFIWTNASGCTDTATVTVTQEPTIILANVAYCLGGNTTLAPIVAPAGGTFLWNTTAVAPSIYVDTTQTSVFEVIYTLGSCSASTLSVVTVYPLPLATVTTIPSVCTAYNGLAIANPSAGTPGYTYAWSPPGGTSDTMINLSPNNYQVTVTDSHLCTVTASGTVGLQTPDIFVTEASQHNLKCFNDATGDIYISVRDTARNSGAYIMTYSWSNNSNTQNLINVEAGPYSVTVTDQFGCTGTNSDTLTQPQPLADSTTFTNPQCFGYANGTATLVNPTGGSGSYYYAWSTTPVQNTPLATGLLAGTYTVSLTDDSACLLTKNVTLTNPLQIAFAPPVLVEPSCFGFSNGSILVTPQNGFIPYTYVWNTNPVQTTDSAIGLIAGTYTVTVTDVNSCTATETIPLGQPLLLTVSITPVNIRCFGYDDGSATANPAGGTPPYTYLWNNEDTTQTISNLVAGTYGVTSTDNNACTTSNSTTLTQPTPLNEVLSSVRDSCPFTATGQIFDTASGGVGGFSYALQANGTTLQTNQTGTFTGLTPGLYTVVATDLNGCPISDMITVPNAPFNYYADTAISTTCYGIQYQDGIIHLQGYAIPNGPFLYSIDGGTPQYTPDFYNLSSGPHTILVQDNYGCDTTFTVVVPEPLPASLQILPGDSTIEPGATIQLTNVFSPYSSDSIKSYMWSPADGLNCIDCPSPMASPYSRQTVYTLVVTYNQSCVDTAFVTINVKGEPPLYIPNAFTPNGNGVNDVWYVFGTGIKDIKIMIFDRWGEKIYESYDQFEGWDGRYKGQYQTPDVYIYEVQIVYLDGVQIFRHGTITLIR
jgi:gliding motility-associated-like protein